MALAAALATPPHAIAGQGSGASILSIAPTTLPGDRPSTVTVTGTDYLVPPHAPGATVFGGVYVIFGWVRPGPGWGPSARSSTSSDGVFGVTYSYAGDGGDAATRDDGSGTTRLVAFTPGGQTGQETPFHMDPNGSWSTTLVIRGPTYEFVDPSTGRPATVDCRLVQCGVFTIGAHGKASPTNERFVPVRFSGGPPVITGAPGPGGGLPSAAPAAAAPAPGGVPSPPGSQPLAPPTAPTTPAGDGPGAPAATAGADRDRTDEPIALRATDSSSASTAPGLWVWIGAAALGVVALLATVVARRRRRSATAP